MAKGRLSKNRSCSMSVRCEPGLKLKLLEMSENEDRDLSNLVVHILKLYLKKLGE